MRAFLWIKKDSCLEIFFCIVALTADSFLHLLFFYDRRFMIGSTSARFFQDSDFLEFLFETSQGFVQLFVACYLYDKHNIPPFNAKNMIKCVSFDISGAKVRLFLDFAIFFWVSRRFSGISRRFSQMKSRCRR